MWWLELEQQHYSPEAKTNKIQRALLWHPRTSQAGLATAPIWSSHWVRKVNTDFRWVIIFGTLCYMQGNSVVKTNDEYPPHFTETLGSRSVLTESAVHAPLLGTRRHLCPQAFVFLSSSSLFQTMFLLSPLISSPLPSQRLWSPWWDTWSLSRKDRGFSILQLWYPPLPGSLFQPFVSPGLGKNRPHENKAISTPWYFLF